MGSIGIDLGTSGVKVALVDEAGVTRATASRAYEVSSPRGGWAESDPLDWETTAISATLEATAAAPAVRVDAVAIDGQMHSTILVDAQGDALRPAVLWPDSRASSVLDEWRACLGDGVRASLANPLSAGMPGPVLAWLSKHEPDVIAQTHLLLSAKDWLRSRIVRDSLVSDPSDSSASLLWDIPSDR